MTLIIFLDSCQKGLLVSIECTLVVTEVQREITTFRIQKLRI